jgi:uncharacterized protein
MTVHHDLIHELPEYRDAIHAMKMSDAHFKRLFEEYHHLTKTIEAMEDEAMPVTTMTEEEAKKKRLLLKDELVLMLKRRG